MIYRRLTGRSTVGKSWHCQFFSITDNALNDISKNASNTLAAQYANDLKPQAAARFNSRAFNNSLSGIGAKIPWGNTYNNQQNGIVNQANLLNQGYTNQMNNAGTGGPYRSTGGVSANPINTGATTQSASTNRLRIIIL